MRLLFNNMSLTYSRVHDPSLRTQVLQRIERYFEDYKSQINNGLPGTDQITNSGREISLKIMMVVLYLSFLSYLTYIGMLPLQRSCHQIHAACAIGVGVTV